MKYITIILLFTINSFCTYSLTVIMDKFNCSKENAQSFLSKINTFTDSLQNNIEYCINSNDTKEVKLSRIDAIIDKYFVSKNSLVQEANINNPNLLEHTIESYLKRLIKLKEIYNYTDAKLYFKPDFTGIGKFIQITENKYELNIIMQEIFIGYLEKKIKYKNIATKKIRFIFTINKSIDEIILKADEILVTETLGK